MMKRFFGTRGLRASLAITASLALFACSESHPATGPAPVATRSAITVDLWSEGMEATPPPPLSTADLSSKFTFVSGSNSSTSPDSLRRVSGSAGSTGITHTGSWSALFRGSSTAPSTGPAPVYTNELRRLIDTSGYTNTRLTYWRRLVGYEASIISGQAVYDRWVIRYSTVASPTASDWTEVQVVTTGASSTWTQGTVEGLPSSSTLWISFLADFKARLNTSVTPNRWQFDEWAYLDDILVTGDTGCGSDIDCSDGIDCTADSCNLTNGVCSNPLLSTGAVCADRATAGGNAAGRCDGAGVCVECTTSAHCPDDGDLCNGAPQCTANACGSGTPLVCDDAAFCNGAETCSPASGCQAGSAPIVDDGVACTADVCDESSDVITHTPSNSACDDGNPCTDDACSATTNCSSTAVVDRVCATGYCAASGSCVACNSDAQCSGNEICTNNACACPPGGCSTVACGNGILEQPSEGCDDGNTISGDGCSSACQSEAAWFERDDVADNGPGVENHQLAIDGAGRMLLAWQSNESGTSGVYARRISATGAVVAADATSALVIDSGISSSIAAEPAVVGLSTGGWVVIWTSPVGPSQNLIAMRTVGQDGSLGFPTFVSSGSDGGVAGASEASARVAQVSGGFVVSWIDTRSGVVTLRARRFDGSASALASSFVIADESAGGELHTTLAASGSEWLVAWSRRSDDTVRVRRYDGASALESAWQLASSAIAPAAAMLPSPGVEYALAWASTSDANIRAVELGSTGTPAPGDIRVVSALNPEMKAYPSIAALGTHAFVVSYDIEGVDADFRAIARTGDSYTNDPSEAGLRALLVAAGIQRGTKLATAENGVWFTWNDDTGVDPGDPFAFPNGLRMQLLGCQGCTLSGGGGCYNVFQKIVPQGAVSQLDRYGESGAKFGEWIAVSGTRMIVGARDDAEAGVEEGAAYIYDLQGSSWVQQTKLLAQDPGPGTERASGTFGAQYGSVVAINGDTAVVGAPSDDGATSQLEAGSVYVYDYAGGAWTETRVLSPDHRSWQQFGLNVAISGDWMMVMSFDGSGSPWPSYQSWVYIYRRDATTGWTHTQTLSSGNVNESLGHTLAIDGNTAFVGGTVSPTGSFDDAAYSVHVFDLQGSNWVEVQQLISSSDEIGNFYGAIKVALQGDVAMVAAPRQDGASSNEGAVYAFIRDAGVWLELQTILSPSPSSGEQFGYSLALNGNVATIGSFPAGGGNELFVYDYGGAWTLNTTINAASLSGPPYGLFRYSSAMAGSDVTVGASMATDAAYAVAPGAVYAFSCAAGLSCGDGWVVAGEQCDDGNTIGGDGCEADCTLSCSATGADTTCNNVDEDCNGAIDDGFVPPPVTCGVGVCQASGTASCVGGGVSASCTPGLPTGSDANCDGADNDCDGRTDEGFVGSSSSCGLGVCATTGSQVCSNGTVVSGCTPLPTTATDDFACDGLDEDCDGLIDEDCACDAATATVSAHQTASRAFLCTTTPTSLISESFESGSLSGWTTTGNYTASTATAQIGTFSAQAQGAGLSTLRRTLSTSGFTSLSLGLWARTRGPLTTGYGLAIRYSTNGGTSWSTVGSGGGPFNTWTNVPNNSVPATPALTLSLEANPTEATRFVHYDNITLTGTCTTSTYFATGSNAQLGTSGTTTTTLHAMDSAPSVWMTGGCPICGNNVLEPGEGCDDGNRIDEGCGAGSCSYCSSRCVTITSP